MSPVDTQETRCVCGKTKEAPLFLDGKRYCSRCRPTQPANPDGPTGETLFIWRVTLEEHREIEVYVRAVTADCAEEIAEEASDESWFTGASPDYVTSAYQTPIEPEQVPANEEIIEEEP